MIKLVKYSYKLNCNQIGQKIVKFSFWSNLSNSVKIPVLITWYQQYKNVEIPFNFGGLNCVGFPEPAIMWIKQITATESVVDHVIEDLL